MVDSQAIKDAQAALERHQSTFEQSLTEHHISYDDIDKVVIEDAPVAVKQAQREYRDAKRHVYVVSHPQQTKQEHFLISWAYDFFPILAVVLIVRSFIIEPFNIPSSSMVPSLYTGDFVAVNKFDYGIRLPLTYTKILDTGSPKHGDVAVFRYPQNPKIYYIKRIIGLPGDTVSNHNGQLSVNGNIVETEKIDYHPDNSLTEQLYTPEKDRSNANREWRLSPVDAQQKGEIEEQYASYYQQQLGKHTYLRRYLSPPALSNDYSPFLGKSINHNSDWEVTVPQGEYFVLGDNSDRSADGRFWGFVPDENLAGKAVYIWMHKKPGLLNMPTFSRNGTID
ncbi:signal peptidase I [Psychrobacter sp. I-STPA10]|uniref:signal peptidase I n=1 Tax=Psychrobacter sp. I-STPA10 TaxID=2585769 RepID=UPI001E37AF74|nr:signal peptidase I [Psychrobacter sp. I-STPA10]